MKKIFLIAAFLTLNISMSLWAVKSINIDVVKENLQEAIKQQKSLREIVKQLESDLKNNIESEKLVSKQCEIFEPLLNHLKTINDKPKSIDNVIAELAKLLVDNLMFQDYADGKNGDYEPLDTNKEEICKIIDLLLQSKTGSLVLEKWINIAPKTLLIRYGTLSKTNEYKTIYGDVTIMEKIVHDDLCEKDATQIIDKKLMRTAWNRYHNLCLDKSKGLLEKAGKYLEKVQVDHKYPNFYDFYYEIIKGGHSGLKLTIQILYCGKMSKVDAIRGINYDLDLYPKLPFMLDENEESNLILEIINFCDGNDQNSSNGFYILTPLFKAWHNGTDEQKNFKNKDGKTVLEVIDQLVKAEEDIVDINGTSTKKWTQWYKNFDREFKKDNKNPVKIEKENSGIEKQDNEKKLEEAASVAYSVTMKPFVFGNFLLGLVAGYYNSSLWRTALTSLVTNYMIVFGYQRSPNAQENQNYLTLLRTKLKIGPISMIGLCAGYTTMSCALPYLKKIKNK